MCTTITPGGGGGELCRKLSDFGDDNVLKNFRYKAIKLSYIFWPGLVHAFLEKLDDHDDDDDDGDDDALTESDGGICVQTKVSEASFFPKINLFSVLAELKI